MRVFSLRLPDELVERVDEARGDVPRNTWVRRAVERALDEVACGDASSVASPRRSVGTKSTAVTSPTPAEQPIPKRAQPLQRTIASHQRVHAPTCKCGICKPVK